MRGRATSPLQEIPGIGPSIAVYLEGAGIRTVADLKGRDPEAIYEAICRAQGQQIDRCLLYVCRCAVYYAEGGRAPTKLKWWNWKDAVPVKKPRRTG
ncbi:MAG: DUF4332 domain-containing protein [Nitrospinae bacterium]|nr:DUF4332 domain-containing protein [Nitrospinota bacterium]